MNCRPPCHTKAGRRRLPVQRRQFVEHIEQYIDPFPAEALLQRGIDRPAIGADVVDDFQPGRRDLKQDAAAVSSVLAFGDEATFLQRPDNPRQARSEDKGPFRHLRGIQSSSFRQNADHPPLLLRDVMQRQHGAEMPHHGFARTKQRNRQRTAGVAGKKRILRDAVRFRGLSRHVSSMDQFFAMRNDAERLAPLTRTTILLTC